MVLSWGSFVLSSSSKSKKQLNSPLISNNGGCWDNFAHIEVEFMVWVGFIIFAPKNSFEARYSVEGFTVSQLVLFILVYFFMGFYKHSDLKDRHSRAYHSWEDGSEVVDGPQQSLEDGGRVTGRGQVTKVTRGWVTAFTRGWGTCHELWTGHDRHQGMGHGPRAGGFALKLLWLLTRINAWRQERVWISNKCYKIIQKE